MARQLLIATCFACLSLPAMAEPRAGEATKVASSRVAATPDLTRQMEPLHRPSTEFRGSLSCSAVACHGGPRPGVADLQVPRGSEYGLWLEYDPHARAALVLNSESSRRMLEQLQIVKSGVVVDQRGYENCRACHHAGELPGDRQVLISGGNGCESCHGPANNWIGTHFLGDRSVGQSHQAGMLALKDLVRRARMCADCHVGSAHRQVNHDLLAAGHPPLRFEMAWYHNRLPKHWRPVEPVTDTAFQKQLWRAGQIATMEASLSLLESRADTEANDSPWPEFAEYNCASCHQHIRGNVSRRSGSPRTAMPAWGDWQYSFIELLDPEPHDAGNSLDDITRAMVRFDRPDRDAIRQLRGRVHAMAASFDAPAADMEARLYQLAEEYSQADKPRGWEAATQLYLGLIAMCIKDDDPSARQREAHERLRSVKRLLMPTVTGGSVESDQAVRDALRRYLQQHSRL